MSVGSESLSLREELLILRSIRSQAEALTRTGDLLLQGQYRNLAGRISALLAIREAECCAEGLQ
jgi:hypothetical protein